MVVICDPFACAITMKIKILQPEVLVELIWVCKVNDSCKQTLRDSSNKFYLFNGWLNKSSIMIYWRLQISTLANKWQFSYDKLCQLSPFQGISSLLLHTRQKGLLTVVMVKMQDYPKLLIQCTSNFFLVTFVQLWWFSIVMDTVYVNF